MRTLWLLTIACGAALLISACGSKTSAAPVPSATAPAEDAPAPAVLRASIPSGGCGTAHASGASVESMVSGNLTRTYRLYIPKDYDSAEPVPLVLNFHGLGSNARQQELYTGIRAEADSANFIAVTPDGTEQPRRWHLLKSNAPDAIDDYAFVRQLIDATSASLCVDQARIYAMGMSDGAFFSSALGCELNDKLAAVAPVAGSPFYAPTCNGKAPVPIIAFHGTADPIVPFEGGVATSFVVNLKSARDNSKAWAQFDGCQSTLTSNRVADDVVLESYAGCRNGAEVQLYVIEEGGHTWPGAMQVRRNGATTRSINATDLIWRFFAAHPRA